MTKYNSAVRKQVDAFMAGGPGDAPAGAPALPFRASATHDMMIHHYVKSHPDLSVIVCFPKACEDGRHSKYAAFTKDLASQWDVLYVKSPRLTFMEMYGALYQLYATERRMKQSEHIV